MYTYSNKQFFLFFYFYTISYSFSRTRIPNFENWQTQLDDSVMVESGQMTLEVDKLTILINSTYEIIQDIDLNSTTHNTSEPNTTYRKVAHRFRKLVFNISLQYYGKQMCLDTVAVHQCAESSLLVKNMLSWKKLEVEISYIWQTAQMKQHETSQFCILKTLKEHFLMTYEKEAPKIYSKHIEFFRKPDEMFRNKIHIILFYSNERIFVFQRHLYLLETVLYQEKRSHGLTNNCAQYVVVSTC
uniref:Uncharacterized protein n=1 Tax=Heterorhabditis bacteriophora TaxID=37862 RepID=A0A1I7XM10_HETBA